VLLNLGGDGLHPAVEAASRGQHLAAVQTSLDEGDADRAEALATHLHTRLSPEATIVTLGRLGALAITPTGVHHAPAVPVAHPQTHGAGAAFSAGYLYALLHGTNVPTALRDACALATSTSALTSEEPHSSEDAITLAV
jgi:sugar/nucleoside kinase (ribokinase family)